MKPASFVAAILLGIVSILHILRLVFHTDVIIGGTSIPTWVSVVGCVAAGALSILVFREASAKTS